MVYQHYNVDHGSFLIWFRSNHISLVQYQSSTATWRVSIETWLSWIIWAHIMFLTLQYFTSTRLKLRMRRHRHYGVNQPRVHPWQETVLSLPVLRMITGLWRGGLWYGERLQLFITPIKWYTRLKHLCVVSNLERRRRRFI